VKKSRMKCYSPIEPEFLTLEAQKCAASLERALPELRSLSGPQHRRPTVRFFEGWEGIRCVYENTLTAESEILNFANSAIVRAHWKEYDREYVAERVKRGIHLRGIAPDDETGRRVQGQDRENIREIRLVPAEEFNFDNEINIYDHKVAIVSFGTKPHDLFGIIIESKEVSETQKQIFEMAWRYAEVMQKSKTMEIPHAQAVLELNRKP